MSVESLSYLSTEQAVADLAFFIHSINLKLKLPKTIKWIVFGCSYAGGLSAFARSKYPHLVYGAISTSSLIEYKLNFPEYVNTVEKSLNVYNKNCANSINEAFRKLDELLKSPNSSKDISIKLRLCDEIEISNLMDVTNLYDILAGELESAVQSHTYWKWDLNVACHIMTNTSISNVLDRFILVLTRMGFTNNRCVKHKYSDRVEKLRNITWSSNDDRLWAYQMCTQLGYFQTSETPTSLFGNLLPLGFYTDMCKDVFGQEFTEKSIQYMIDHANIFSGGLDLEIDRVIYIHNTADPWSGLGTVRKATPNTHVIVINGTSHCRDMSRAHPSDPPGLVEARNKVSAIIGQWLRDP